MIERKLRMPVTRTGEADDVNAKHLRCAQCRSMPWRNGSGTTLEIAREPIAGSDFLWRLSLATVAADGPFSNYTGYRRSVTLIAGEGLRLATADRQPVVLDRVGATALFDGAAPVHCALIAGACSDLSLMVRVPGAIVSVRRFQGDAVQVLPLAAAVLNAVFCLRGSARLVQPKAATDADPMGPGLQLAQHDTVLIGPDQAPRSLRACTGALADLLLLTWTSSGAAARSGEARPLSNESTRPVR
jgi:environmental stress-induced protein Ves